MNVIETHALTRVFGKKRAVDTATLQVVPGTVFGLLGPNRAGKSTLLKLLAGHAGDLVFGPVAMRAHVSARLQL